MESQYCCPQEILQQPTAAKFSYFQNVIIPHPKLVEVKTKLAQAIKGSTDGSMLFLYGPKGVGISTVLKRVVKEQSESSPSTFLEGQALTSANGFEVLPLEFKNQSMTGLYVRALGALSDSSNNLFSTRRLTELSLGLLVEKTLREQQRKVFYIDSAHRLVETSKSADLGKRMNCIQSLATSSGVKFLLGGNYHLLEQFCPRSIYIEFPRYQFDVKQDFQNFLQVIHMLQRHLPLRAEPNLLMQHTFCCERSIGCVGILKDWLLRALAAALEEDSDTLILQHLEQSTLSAEQCKFLLSEAQHGERFFGQSVPDFDLQRALGLEVNRPTVGNVKKLRV